MAQRREPLLVPANSFAEYAPEPNPETKKKDVVWFALNEDRPLFAFAGDANRPNDRACNPDPDLQLGQTSPVNLGCRW